MKLVEKVWPRRIPCLALRTLNCRVLLEKVPTHQFAVVKMCAESRVGWWRFTHEGPGAVNTFHVGALGPTKDHDLFLRQLRPQFRELGKQVGTRHIFYVGLIVATVTLACLSALHVLAVAATFGGAFLPSLPSLAAVALGLGIEAMLCQAIETIAVHRWLGKIDAAIVSQERQRAMAPDSRPVLPSDDLRPLLEQLAQRFAVG